LKILLEMIDFFSVSLFVAKLREYYAIWHSICVISRLLMAAESSDTEKENSASETPSSSPPEGETLIAPPRKKWVKDEWKVKINALQSKIKTIPSKIRAGLPQSFDQKAILKAFQNFDPQATAEWISKAIQNRGIAFYGTLTTILLCTYFLADIFALLLNQFIPEPPSRPLAYSSSSTRMSRFTDDYREVISRNLFSSKGLIPGDEEGSGAQAGGPAARTTLPLALVGTIIMPDESLSLATLEDKSASQVYPVRVDDEIPGKLSILKIEPRKVTFYNKLSSRKEYIDIPEDQNTISRVSTPRGGANSGPSIEKLSSTQFSVSRLEVDKAMSDFNNILTQARAVPNFENGVAAGYKLFQIVPGSIYDKLGLQNGDVITGLNGTPINDPGKAFEMLNELKTANHLELQVKKDSKQMTYTYDIH
jgi:general secretion pathway protein C